METSPAGSLKRKPEPLQESLDSGVKHKGLSDDESFYTPPEFASKEASPSGHTATDASEESPQNIPSARRQDATDNVVVSVSSPLASEIPASTKDNTIESSVVIEEESKNTSASPTKAGICEINSKGTSKTESIRSSQQDHNTSGNTTKIEDEEHSQKVLENQGSCTGTLLGSTAEKIIPIQELESGKSPEKSE